MARPKPVEVLLGKAHARKTQERWEVMEDNKAMKRALAAFVDAYRDIGPIIATPAVLADIVGPLDDAYDLAKEVLEAGAKAEDDDD